VRERQPTIAMRPWGHDHTHPDAELAGLAGSIRRMTTPPLQTHVIFNNNMEDQGQCNARTMRQLVDG
jgi:uncharacterized protein YecE (DUF72 family)